MSFSGEWNYPAELPVMVSDTGSGKTTQLPKMVAEALEGEWNVSPERAAELARENPETDWREVSKGKAEGYQEYFCFPDPPGWGFYLPAFMCHCLTGFPGYG